MQRRSFLKSGVALPLLTSARWRTTSPGDSAWVYDASSLTSATDVSVWRQPVLSSSEDTLFCGDSEGYFHALNTSDGSEKGWTDWPITTAGDSAHGAVVSTGSGEVYHCSGNNELYAFDTSNGNEQWTSYPSGSFGNLVFAPEVSDTEGIVCCMSRTEVFGMHKEDTTATTAGTEAWSETFSNDDNYFTTLAVGSGYVCTTFEDDIHCLNVANGNTEWSENTSYDVYENPTIDGTSVYVMGVDPDAGNATLFEYDLTTGSQLNNHSLGDYLPLTGVAVANSGFYYGAKNASTGDFALRALNPDGSPNWTNSYSGKYVTATPTVEPDGTDTDTDPEGLYYCTSDGVLRSHNPLDGSEDWTYGSSDSTFGTVHGSPTVGTDNVYVGTANGFIYAIEK